MAAASAVAPWPFVIGRGAGTGQRHVMVDPGRHHVTEPTRDAALLGSAILDLWATGYAAIAAESEGNVGKIVMLTCLFL